MIRFVTNFIPIIHLTEPLTIYCVHIIGIAYSIQDVESKGMRIAENRMMNSGAKRTQNLNKKDKNKKKYERRKTCVT